MAFYNDLADVNSSAFSASNNNASGYRDMNASGYRTMMDSTAISGMDNRMRAVRAIDARIYEFQDGITCACWRTER